MKTNLTLILLACMTCAPLFAQSSEDTDDNTIKYNNLVSKKVIYEDGVRRSKFSISFPTIESTKPSSKLHRCWGQSTEFGPDRPYIGFCEMVNPEGYKINPGSSWEWGFSLMRFTTWHPSNRFGFNTELNLSRSSYRIKGNDAMHIDDQGYTVCDDALYDDLHYRRQRLIHWSWRVPVEMIFQTRGEFQYILGVEGELRHHVRSRARVGKTKKYFIDRNNLDVEPFGYNAVFGFGQRDFTIYGRVNISDFFGSKSRVDAQPFAIVIKFSGHPSFEYNSY